MDKYEFNLSLKEIKRLVAARRFPEAADIADTIDWNRVRTPETLCLVSDIYKYIKECEKSREILMLANARRPGDPNIIYSLCELTIYLYGQNSLQSDLALALQLLTEYQNMEPSNPKRLILQYKMYQVSPVSNAEKISVLEQLADEAYSAKWAYELAELYHEAGQDDKAAAECRNIMRNFDGRYADAAADLLTELPEPEPVVKEEVREEEEDTSDYTKRIPDKEEDGEHSGDEDKTGEEPEKAEEEPAADESPEPEEAQQEEVKEEKAAEESAEESVHEADLPITTPDEQEGKDSVEKTIAKSMERIYDRPYDAHLAQETSGQYAMVMEEEKPEETQVEGQLSIGEVMDEWEKIRRGITRANDEKRAQRILEDTGPILEDFDKTAQHGLLEDIERGTDRSRRAVRSGYRDYVRYEAEEDDDAATRRWDPHSVRRAVSHSAADRYDDYVNDPYERRRASREEEDRIAAEEARRKEEHAAAEEARIAEIKRRAVEEARKAEEERRAAEEARKAEEARLAEEARRAEEERLAEEARRAEEERLAEEARRAEEARLAEEARRAEEQRLAEEAAARERSRIAAEEAARERARRAAEEARRAEEERLAAEEARKAEEARLAEEARKAEEARLAAEARRAEEERIAAEEARKAEEARIAAEAVTDLSEAELPVFGEEEEPAQEERPAERIAAAPAEEVEIPASPAEEPVEVPAAEPVKEAEAAADEAAAEPAASERTVRDETGKVSTHALSKEDLRLFGPFSRVKENRQQLAAALDKISLASYTGNLVITGNEQTAQRVATGVLEIIKKSDANFSGKVAKASAESLNKRSAEQISSTMERFENGAMVISQAASLSDNAVAALYKELEMREHGLIVILTDARTSMDQFLAAHAKQTESFNARIDIKPLTDKALIQYAKDYANNSGYSLDEFAEMALRARIAALQTPKHHVTLKEVRDMVDEAIARASRKTPNALLGRLTGKRYDEEDRIILHEKDFTN